jgi:class 3 adenylate cyclase/tetratricopeptide (TPR) repeat protein
VSVLFVDLVGFTTFSEGRDAEDVREMLSRYFETAQEVIGLYGGVVEKFIGDAVMAVWGTPIAREDDPGRAVRAALELIEAVPAMGRSFGAELQARAGVFTGEAAVNLAAQGQGMVAGDTVNTASRLQSAADPGSVLVDRTTYLGARDGVSFEPAGDLTLKGKGEVIEAWRPLRVIAAIGGFRPDSLEPAFTGRDEEFRLIKDLLHLAAREQKPRLASVMGIGGIGKSRLVWELFKYIDGLSDLIFWHQGRSPAYGEGVAFWSLAEMVRMRAKIAETDDDEAALAKLDECIEEYFPDGDGAWLRPHLAHLIGLGGSTDATREQLFSAWRTLFEQVALLGPVILIFEDLHWADPGLVDFIEHVMESSRNSPILILTLARPELMDRRPNWGAGQRNFTSIHLEALDNDDMNLLLKSVAGDLPDSVRSEIIDRSEGVPLYAVEMVRMLIDRNDLVAEGDGYRWVGESGHIDVPDSLHSLIASRLDSLETSDRVLVQDASVLGKTFTLESLAWVSGVPATELEPRLADLAKREIFVLDNDPRSPERGQFGFVQSLIKEVAYQTLSNQNRRNRHVAAAEFFVSTGDADVIDVTATHYLEAYKNSSQDQEGSGMLAQLAREALVDASERARSLGSHEQAIALLDAAFDITLAPEERARIAFRAGNAGTVGGLFDVAIERLRTSVELLEDSPDADLRAEVKGWLGTAYYSVSRLDEAVELLTHAIEELEDPTESLATPRLYTELAKIYAFKMDLENCDRYTRLGIEAAERNNDIALIADALITRGVNAVLASRPREAEVILGGALQFAEKNGLVKEQIRALINKSANEGGSDPRAAVETAKRGAELAHRYGFTDDERFLWGNAAEASIALAEWEWVRDLLATIGPSSERNVAVFMPEVFLGVFTGDLDGARACMARMEAFFETTSSSQDLAGLAVAKAAIAFAEGDYHQCLKETSKGADEVVFTMASPVGFLYHAALLTRDVEEAHLQLEVLRKATIQTAWHQAHRATLEAGIAALEGERDRAVELFNEALDRWAAIDIPLCKAMCQMDMALLVGGAEVHEAAAEAAEFFRSAGNDRFVRLIEDASIGV